MLLKFLKILKSEFYQRTQIWLFTRYPVIVKKKSIKIMLTCTMKYVYNDRLLVSLSDNKIYFYMPILCQSHCSETEMQSLCGVSTLTVIIWFTFIIFFRDLFVILTSTFPFH